MYFVTTLVRRDGQAFDREEGGGQQRRFPDRERNYGYRMSLFAGARGRCRDAHEVDETNSQESYTESFNIINSNYDLDKARDRHVRRFQGSGREVP